MSPPLMVTEDTPPDMLTGHMDLRLVLHNGSRVRMSVDRKTPMMDLLVQVTTAYKISPAGYVLQPYGETGILPYKPSTPIGALDTWTVHIVPKNQALQNPASKISLKQVQQPFEQTFRFQVNLPKNQLYVTRVTGRTTMRDLLYQACSEKGLDPHKYSLRHPKQMDQPLCEDVSVMEYGHNQVSMVSNRMLPSAVSSENILAMAACSGKSSESSSRSLSPDSSSGQRTAIQPSRPARKRRPAPKPPAKPAPQPPNIQKKDTQKSRPPNEPVICHSRTSSDSSGYHEASVLSESPDSNNSSFPDSLPRRSKLPTKTEPKPSNKLSRSLSNLHHESTVPQTSMKPAQSTSCLAPSRKKKPAPAPPVLSITEEEREETILARSSHTLPANARLSEMDPSSVDIPLTAPPKISPQSSRLSSPLSTVAPSVDQPKGLKIDEEPTTETSPKPSSRDAENERVEEEIERMFEEATREHVSLESGVDVGESSPGIPSPDVSGLPSPDLIPDTTPEPELTRLLDTPIETNQADDPFNWEYKLPAPPTFRDIVDREATSSPILTTYSTMTVGNIKEVLYQPSLADDRPDLPKIVSATERNVDVVRELAAVVGSGTSILSAPRELTDVHPKPRIVADKLDNFRITTYSSNNEAGEVLEEKTSRKRYETNLAQRSSFTDKDWPNKEPKPVERRAHLSGGVKRSLSHVSHLAKARFTISNSTSDLRSAELSGDPPDLLRDGPLYAMRPTPALRKTSSEISINIDPSETKAKQSENDLPNGLQSLNVLRRILPQLSRSQGALNKIENSNIKNSQTTEDQGFVRPNISLSTWGERPKRQISIKYDRDYVFGGMKSAQPTSLNGLAKPSTVPVKSAIPEKPTNPGTNTSPSHKGPKTLAYKMLETGNTKPLKQILERDKNYDDPPEIGYPGRHDRYTGINSSRVPKLKQPNTIDVLPPRTTEKETKLQSTVDSIAQPVKEASSLDNLHVPIVRGVELKKPYRMELDNRMVKEPVVPPAIPEKSEFLVVREFLKSRDNFQQVREPQPRPASCYLFGYEPKVSVPTPPAPPPPQPKKFNSVVDLSKVTLKPVGSRNKLRQREVDPREELMASIRNFGKNNLRKVSAR